jgi:predicted DNA-binding ribbon-helix-helix protein
MSLHTLKKHSVKLCGHSTSITIEDIFWDSLQLIAQQKNMPLKKLIEQIDEARQGNLSSALRVYVCHHYQLKLAAIKAI